MVVLKQGNVAHVEFIWFKPPKSSLRVITRDERTQRNTTRHVSFVFPFLKTFYWDQIPDRAYSQICLKGKRLGKQVVPKVLEPKANSGETVIVNFKMNICHYSTEKKKRKSLTILFLNFLKSCVVLSCVVLCLNSFSIYPKFESTTQTLSDIFLLKKNIF